MSLAFLCICPITGCKYNTHPIFANLPQIKKHLKYSHDYKEKQATAFSFGLIDFSDERHSSSWFVSNLIPFSKIKEKS